MELVLNFSACLCVSSFSEMFEVSNSVYFLMPFFEKKTIKMAVTTDVSLTLHIKDSIYIHILWNEGKDYIFS